MSRIATTSRARLRCAWAAGASAAALALWAGPAMAQDGPETPARRRRRRTARRADRRHRLAPRHQQHDLAGAGDRGPGRRARGDGSGLADRQRQPAAAVLRQHHAQQLQLLRPRRHRQPQLARPRPEPHADAAQRPPRARHERVRRRGHQPVPRGHDQRPRDGDRRRLGGVRHRRGRRRGELPDRYRIRRSRSQRAIRRYRPRRRRQLRAQARLRHGHRRARPHPCRRLLCRPAGHPRHHQPRLVQQHGRGAGQRRSGETTRTRTR